MKTILVPTDFSTNAANALAYAVHLAAQVRGKIILFHALTSQILGLPEGEKITLDPDLLLRNGYLAELDSMAKIIKLENGFKFEVETICEKGTLESSILQLIEEKRVDLIVMGTRGASTFLGKIIGTNTLGLMRESTCPVLAIPAKATFKGFKDLAYASDFEKDDSSYLTQLRDIAQPFQAEINILNVNANDQLNLVPDSHAMAGIEKAMQNSNYTVIQVSAATVVDGIKAFTRKNPVDVVAVAIEKRGYLDTIFHSSVSAKLAFDSTLPLLALPGSPSGSEDKQ